MRIFIKTVKKLKSYRNELITKEYPFRKILVIHLYIVKYISNKLHFNFIFHTAALIILKYSVNTIHFLLKCIKLLTLPELYPEFPQKAKTSKMYSFKLKLPLCIKTSSLLSSLVSVFQQNHRSIGALKKFLQHSIDKYFFCLLQEKLVFRWMAQHYISNFAFW